MIDVLTTATIKKTEVTLFGKIDTEENTIELNFPAISGEATEFIQEIIYSPKMSIRLFDMSARAYSMYGCKFLQHRLTFASTAVSVIKGNFERVVQEPALNCTYNSVSFRFLGIEKIFPLETFKTQWDNETGEIVFSKNEHTVETFSLYSDILLTVESNFDGISDSDTLYDLDVKQHKTITLTLKVPNTIDFLLSIVDRIKQFFEFVLKQEILITNIQFGNTNNAHRQSSLVCDSILHPKTFIESVKDNPYSYSHEILFAGLDGWLKNYDEYIGVIHIWQKTIYNTNVSPEDLFIWRCQAFELLCSINKQIFEAATVLKDRKQANPNLKNFLSAVSSTFKILERIDIQHYKDLKEVRDKLTHNNPQKRITSTQKENSFALIEFFVIKTMCSIFAINGVSASLILKPLDNQSKNGS